MRSRQTVGEFYTGAFFGSKYQLGKIARVQCTLALPFFLAVGPQTFQGLLQNLQKYQTRSLYQSIYETTSYVHTALLSTKIIFYKIHQEYLLRQRCVHKGCTPVPGGHIPFTFLTSRMFTASETVTAKSMFPLLTINFFSVVGLWCWSSFSPTTIYRYVLTLFNNYCVSENAFIHKISSYVQMYHARVRLS